MRNPRVYITNDTGLDFERASQHGDLIRLCKGSVDPFKPHLAQKMVADALVDFDARLDYLLPSGSALATGFAFALLALHADDGRDRDTVAVKLLLFDSKSRDYMVRTVEL